MSFEDLYALTLLIEGSETKKRWPFFAKILKTLKPTDFTLVTLPDGTFVASQGETQYALSPKLVDGIADLADVIDGSAMIAA